MFKKLACLLLVMMLALSATTPALAMSVKVKVNTSSARAYKKASSSSKSVKLKKGTQMTMKGITGSWAKVSYKGRTGYVPLKYLSTTKRTRGYAKNNAYIYKSPGSSSRSRVSANTVVYVVGKSGSYYRVQNASGSRTGYMKASSLSKSRVKVTSSSKRTSSKSSKSFKSKVVKMNWFKGGSSVLRKGSYAYIYDINTGTKIRIKRMGGHNHADVEPATARDTAKLRRIAGGHFSWASRAVILKSRGKYVACAINTMPHGSQTIRSNNYDGQFCLHMSGSLTHCSGIVKGSHQAAINRAYNWAH